MNAAYFAHLWRAFRWRLLLVVIALIVWGSLLPIVYDAFGEQFEELMDTGVIPTQFTQFGGGDIFSLTGSVALGFIHPFAVALNLVFAVGLRRRCHRRGAAARARSRSCSPGPSRDDARTARVAIATALFVVRDRRGADPGCPARLGDHRPGRRARRGEPAAAVAERRAPVRGVRGGRAGGVGLVRPARAGPRRGAGVRARVVLPRGHRLALAGRGVPAGLLAVPLPRCPRRPDRAAPVAATSGSSPRSSSSAVGYALVVFPRRDLAAPA